PAGVGRLAEGPGSPPPRRLGHVRRGAEEDRGRPPPAQGSPLVLLGGGLRPLPKLPPRSGLLRQSWRASGADFSRPVLAGAGGGPLYDWRMRMRWAAALVALALVGGLRAAESADRLDEFKVLARRYTDADADSAAKLLAQLFSVVDGEVLDNLRSG